LALRLGNGIERQAASLGHNAHATYSRRRARRDPRRRSISSPAGRYDAGVEVVIAQAARGYIRDHGGTVFVRSHPHRCCTGSLTLLDATTVAPEDASDFLSFDTGGIGVRFLGGSSGTPNQLTIELRGVLNRHPVAFWDGCAYKP
jgi:hypothetical protein